LLGPTTSDARSAPNPQELNAILLGDPEPTAKNTPRGVDERAPAVKRVATVRIE
jgi:hypothetical protein